ncbi:transposase [Mesorhizobium sp. M0029]|uniref:transposase n=1 Tax=Mesorhizobium sp. M0029 TaxID=2956850 RepID=UPI00333E148D
MAPLRGWRPKGQRLWLRPARALENPDLPGRVALRQTHRTMCLRRPHQRRMLPRLCASATAPKLRPGDIGIIDNLGSHKSAAIRHAIRAAGSAKLWFLPPYSPDLNPCMDGSCGSRVSDRVW